MVLRRSFSGTPLGRLKNGKEHRVRRWGTCGMRVLFPALISDIPTSNRKLDWLLRSLLGFFSPPKTQLHGTCS